MVVRWVNGSLQLLGGRATLSVPRLGPPSGPTSGAAVRIIDGLTFPFTIAGLQAANNELKATGGGEIWVPATAGIPIQTTPLKLSNRVILRGFGAYGLMTTFVGDAATNVPFVIGAEDTSGGQEMCGIEGISINGGSDHGGRVDAGIKLKRIFVGTFVRDVDIAYCSGIGLRIEGTADETVGQLVVDYVSTHATGSYGVLVNSGATSVWFDHLSVHTPGRKTAGVAVIGPAPGSATPNWGTRFSGLYTEVTDSMSVGLLIDGASGVEVDGMVASKAGGRFRSAVKIQNTLGGSWYQSPAGVSLKSIYSQSDTLVEDVPNNLTFDVGPYVSTPMRSLAWYTSPVSQSAAGDTIGDDYRAYNQIIGMQPAKRGPDLPSAAGIAPPVDGANAFHVTGTTTITGITGREAHRYKATTFIVDGVCLITWGGNLHLNGNFLGPGQLTLMWNGSYWLELSRSLYGATSAHRLSASYADSLRANLGLAVGGQPVNKILRSSAALDFPAITAPNTADLTITVTGAALGDEVFLGVPNGSVTAATSFTAWVSAANTVTVRAAALAGTPNPASGTFKVTVFQ